MGITSINNSISHKPSVLDAVLLSGVKSVPIVEMLAQKTLQLHIHAWITDNYAAPVDNAHPEISGLGETPKPTKQKTENCCQILKNEIMVTKRQLEIAQYGGKELEYQRAKKAIEHIKDLEYALLGLGHKSVFDKYIRSNDAERVADRMAGFFYFVPDSNRFNFDADKNGQGTDFSEFTYEMLCEMLQPVWEKGGIDDGKFKIFMGSTLKGRVNKWVENNQSMRLKVEGEYNPLIDTIATDFGAVKIQMHRLFEGEKLKDKVLAGNFDESKICYLTKTTREEVKVDKTIVVERFYTDCTLEVTNGEYFSCGAGLK